MKSIKTFLSLMITILSLQTSAAQNGKKNEKAVIKTTIYCSHCKQCETCGKNFDAELLKIKGLKMYELDEKNMTIIVYYNGTKTNLESIKTAISKLGYDADDIKADAAGYEKLDNCCKKV